MSVRGPAAVWPVLLGLLAAPADAWQAADPSARPAGPPSPEAARGTYNALVIFAKFAGEAPGSDRKPSWADDLFDDSRPGSLTHFYDEMSGGELRVSGQVLPRRYESLEPASAYLADSSGTLGDFGRFNREVLQKADADVDMGAFDNDGPDGVPNSGDDDGYVDILFINLHTAPENFFITRATGIASLGLNTEFLSDDEAAGGGVIRVRDRFSGFAGTTQRGHVFGVTAGTMCHEFAHLLGLPDLFDQSSISATGELDPAEESAGIGKWGLMGLGILGWGEGDGPNAFSAWSLAKLGWLGPGNERLVEVTESMREVELESIDRGGRVLKVSLTPDEYFLIENRQAHGFYNRNIPGGGLLVWHVDERADNDEERHKQVDLVCADGLYADRGYPGGDPDPVSGRDNLDFHSRDPAYDGEHNGNEGDATDPFDGVRFQRLAFDTNPGLRGHAGSRRGVPLGFVLDRITPLENGRMGLDVLLRQPAEGQVTGSERWSGEVAVEGDIVVEAGASLTLAPGTRVSFAAADSRGTGFDPGRCELIVYGELVVEGDSAAPVRLTHAEGSGWLGVLVFGGGSPGLEPARDAGGLILEGARLGIARDRLPPGTTRWGGKRSIPWDLLVPAGAVLDIAPGSETRFAPGDLALRGTLPEHVELTVEGRLTVAATAADPAVFTVDSILPEELWAGLRLAAGGAVDATGLRLDQAIIGIGGEMTAEGGFHLADASLERLARGVDVGLFGMATIDRATFRSIADRAVWVRGAGHLRMRSSVVEENGREGVVTSGAGLVLIDTRVSGNGVLDSGDPRSGLLAEGGVGRRLELWRSTVEGNELHGLELDGWRGVIELHGTHITANRRDGLRVDGAERMVFEEVEVHRNRGTGAHLASTASEVWTTDFDTNLGGGLRVEGGTVAVEMSHFTANGAVLTGTAAAAVRTSEFVNAAVGLHSVDSAPAIVGNLFTGNVTALRIDGPAVPDPIRDNHFEGNSLALENRSDEEVDARGNYWGTNDPEKIAGQLSGAALWTPFLSGEPPETSVAEGAGETPLEFVLRDPWPNPFNAATAIAFDLPRAAPLRLAVHDVLGRRVRTLRDEARAGPGRFRVVWDGADDRGRPAASGVYLVRLTAGADRTSGRVVLVR